MIVSINQPAYLPWLGYFDRIAKADIHIVLDHVQFEKNGMTNRNKIRTASSWNWLTVPVRTKSRFGKLNVSDIEIDNSSFWAKKHWKTLHYNYSRALYFSDHASFFEEVYATDWAQLAPLLSHTNKYLLDALCINTQIVSSSDLKAKSSKSDLILELCEKVGATKYISGPFGRDYLDFDAFIRAGIALEFHDYSHPCYSQVYEGFEPYMSVVDLLFNHGLDSLDILRS